MKLRRRRVPRQPADWFGKCLIEEDAEAVWFECRVVDISILGAGVEVFGFAPRDLVGQRLIVEVQPPSATSLSVHLVGEVRNVAAAHAAVSASAWSSSICPKMSARSWTCWPGCRWPGSQKCLPGDQLQVEQGQMEMAEDGTGRVAS